MSLVLGVSRPDRQRHARRRRLEVGAAAVAACAPMSPTVCPRGGALTPRARLRDARRNAHTRCVYAWQTLVGSSLLWHGLMMAGTTSTCTSSQCYRDPNTVRAPASLTFASPYIPQHPNIFMCSCLSSVCAVRKFDSRASATARAAAARAAAVRRDPSKAPCRQTSLMPPQERGLRTHAVNCTLCCLSSEGEAVNCTLMFVWCMRHELYAVRVGSV